MPDNLSVRGAFLSTPSARRATRRVRSFWDACSISIHALREEGDVAVAGAAALAIDFYPRPPRGGRPFAYDYPPKKSTISIHALREEGDQSGAGRRKTAPDFYPRPPRGGRPALLNMSKCWIVDFYPRPPRGGRQVDGDRGRQQVVISIHALREEGDMSTKGIPAAALRFLSTPSARRATCCWVLMFMTP